MTAEPNTRGTHPWLAIGALAFGCAAFLVLLVLYIWQIDVRDSKVSGAEEHATAVLHLQDAAASGDIAGELLAAYVLQGDDTLIPQINSHAEDGVAALTSALAASRSDSISRLATGGIALTDGAGKVIALRQNGNVESAAATLEDLRPQFDQFALALEATTNAELEQAASLQTDADNADTTAAYFLITSLAVGIATVAGLLYVIGVSLLRRRIPETPTPA